MGSRMLETVWWESWPKASADPVGQERRPKACRNPGWEAENRLPEGIWESLKGLGSWGRCCSVGLGLHQNKGREKIGVVK